MINLLDLAAACVAGTDSASKSIAARRAANGQPPTTTSTTTTSTSSSSSSNVRVKADGSLVTDADFTAQGAIVKAIRSVSDDIDILGEESADEVASHLAAAPAVDESVLHRTKLELRLRYFGGGSSSSTTTTAVSSSPHHHHQQYHQYDGMPMPLATTTTGSSTTTTNNNQPFMAQSALSPGSYSALAPGTANKVSNNNNHNRQNDNERDENLDEPDDDDDDESSSLYVDVSRLRIIVDPLDGTKSYTNGEYEAVSILIAIMLDHQPYFGVIGKPFGYQRNGGQFPPMLDGTCVTFYGGPLLQAVYVAGGGRIGPPPPMTATVTMGSKGGDAAHDGNVGCGEDGKQQQQQQQQLLVQEPPLSLPATPAPLPRTVISSSRSQGVVHDFCLYMADQGLVHAEPMLVSGAGEKSLRLILQTQGESLWFYPKPGTSLWDVAAPDALLRALRGKLTDKYGRDIDYDKSREAAENVDGIVACIDADLHAKCIALFQQGDWLGRQ